MVPSGRLLPAVRKSWLAAGLAPVVAVSCGIVTVVRLIIDRPHIAFWGDQAVDDVVARDTLTGHNLLGVYSRYGWHHPGPVWLGFLGLGRALSGGSTLGTGVTAIVWHLGWGVTACVAARRLHPRLTWPTAATVALTYWVLGYIRMTRTWNPYAVALPALVLLLAGAACFVARRPWPRLCLLAVTATVAVQTDVSTVGVALGMAVMGCLAVAGRYARRSGSRPDGTHGLRWVGAALIAGVALWAPPVYQELSGGRAGNLRTLATFAHTHQSTHHWSDVLGALDSLFGWFPLRVDLLAEHLDSTPTILTAHPFASQPYALVSLVAVAALAVVAWRTRDQVAGALLVTTVVATASLAVTIRTAYGPLYPYLVIWAVPIVALPWIAALVMAARSFAPLARPLPVFAVAAAALSIAASLPYPSGQAVNNILGELAWRGVGPSVMNPDVRSVTVIVAARDSAPSADAAIDAIVAHHRSVHLEPAYAARYDPHLDLGLPSQLTLTFCCGTTPGNTGTPPPGARDIAVLLGYQVYASN